MLNIQNEYFHLSVDLARSHLTPRERKFVANPTSALFSYSVFPATPDTLIKRCKAVENLMPDSGHNPAFNNLNANFCLALSFGLRCRAGKTATL